MPAGLDRRGAEAARARQPAAERRGQPPRHRDRVALDDQVEVHAGRRRRAARRAPRRRRPTRPAARRGSGAAAGSARTRSREIGGRGHRSDHLPSAPDVEPPATPVSGADCSSPSPSSSLLAGGAVAFVLAHKPGDVSQPGRRVPRRDDGDARAAREAAGGRPLPVADVRLREDRRATSATRRATSARPSDAAGPTAAACCSSSRRRSTAARSTCSTTTAMLHALDKTSGRIRWQQRSGASPPPRRRRRRQRLRRRAARDRGARRAASPPTAPRTAGSCGRRRCRAAPSPRRCSTNGRLYFGSENGTVYALDAKDGRTSGPTRRAARSRAAWRSPTASSTSATTAAASTRSARSSGREVWSVGTTARASASARASSTRPPAVAYGRVYIGNTDGQRLLVRRRQRQARVGDGHRRLRLRARPPSRRCRAAARPSTSAPTTAHFYALDARSGEVRWKLTAPGTDLRRRDGRRRHRLLLRPAAANDTIGLDARTGRKVFAGPRRLQPGRLRPARDLPRRLRQPLRLLPKRARQHGAGERGGAARGAPDNARRPRARDAPAGAEPTGRTGTPAAARWRLELGRLVYVAVVEDRGARTASAPASQAVDEVVELAGAAGGDHRHVDRAPRSRASARGRSRPWCRRGPSSVSRISPAPRSTPSRAHSTRVAPGRRAAAGDVDLPAVASRAPLGVDRQHHALGAEHARPARRSAPAARPRRS